MLFQKELFALVRILFVGGGLLGFHFYGHEASQL